MDKQKGILNVSVSIFQKLLLMVLTILVRRFLIKYVGNDVNGLNSLYASIIGILAVSELGIGSAITYCMYKPIIDGDYDKVSALYELFKKLYFAIGLFIFCGGIVVIFFLPHLAADYSQLNVNVNLTFLLALINTVITYCYSSKLSLINAFKNNYISTTITSAGYLLSHVLQLITLAVFRSFEIYLVCAIVGNIFAWTITEIIVSKMHKDVIIRHSRIDRDTKIEVTKNIKAMFMHKVGGVLVNTSDSVVISTFIGVVALAGYSNYNVIIASLFSIMMLFFTPLTSVIGHMCAEEDIVKIQKYFNFLYSFNFVLGVVFFLGYYAIIDNLVYLLFGPNLELSKPISFIITLNQFTQFMRQTTLTFRDATGTFYHDRWKPIAEGICNIILSVLFVIVLPDEIKIVGVIIATILTNLMICHVVEPYVLYRYAFGKMPTKYYLKNYSYIGIFIIALLILNSFMQTNNNQWVELLTNGFISVGVSAVICVLVYLADKDFRNQINVVINQLKNRLLSLK